MKNKEIKWELSLRGRLCWYGHVERMEKNSWINRIMTMNVEEGARGRSTKTSWEITWEGHRLRRVCRENAQDSRV